MTDKIEIGEYVRYKDGTISKVIDIDNNRDFDLICENFTLSSKFVVNHAKNIIDLIQIGDYVNGYEVIDKYLFNGEIPVLETIGNETNCKCLCNKDIKIILTKEMYEQNCYKVVE